MIFRQSPYTRQELKALKTLESYRYHEAGFVLELKHWFNTVNLFYLFRSRVKHGQKQNDTPLKVWVAVKPDGEILFGHCVCMAGLGEVCSHFGATLYHLVAIVKAIQETTCTGRPCSWVIPAMNKDIPYEEAAKIQFKKQVNPPYKPKHTEPPSQADKNAFYSALHGTGVKSAVLSLVPAYAAEYVPKSTTLPKSLQSLYKQEHESLNVEELETLCKETFTSMNISRANADKIAELTKQQSKTKLWYYQRAGRITASKAKACFATSCEKPSMSLIKSVCYPNLYKFTSKKTEWGCCHEKNANSFYKNVFSKNHANLSVTATGFHISHTHPFIGASPDGLTKCNCCGEGLLEIKCPFSCTTGKQLQEMDYLKTVNGRRVLDRNHNYYYQVQLQMFVLERKFCDFVCWSKQNVDPTKPEVKVEVIYVERIMYDKPFVDKFIEKTTGLYINVILPELLCKKFTRALPLSEVNVNGQSSNTLSCSICYCGNEDLDSPILTCASDKCPIKRYHMSCLKLQRKPPGANKGEWLCNDCKKQNKKQGTTKVDENSGTTLTTCTICICGNTQSDSPVLTCGSDKCPIKQFHMSCLKLDRKPSGKSNWLCPDCKKKSRKRTL